MNELSSGLTFKSRASTNSTPETAITSSKSSGGHPPGPPNRPSDHRTVEKKKRRRFTATYKIQILKEADACRNTGRIGAILKREGLYPSSLSVWRRQRDQGLLAAMSPRKRGRKVKETSPIGLRIARLEKENRQLARKLKQAETIMAAQKRIGEMLGHTGP